MTQKVLKSLCFIWSFYWVSNTSAEAVSLKLLNWEHYISAAVIDKFTAETGISVNVIHYAGDSSRDQILASPAAKAFDLVVIDNFATGSFSSSGLLLDLSQQPLPNRKHLDPRWQQGCGNYGVPYFWGTLGIAYRPDKVDPAPTSWSDLLKPEAKYSGHIGMVLDSIDTLVPALKLLGYSINTHSEDELKSAFQLLMQQKPSVLTYEYAGSFIQSESVNDLYMTLAYSVDLGLLNRDDNRPWHYVIPAEGTAQWVDCLAVLSSSSNIAQSIAFIDFINRPEIAALNAEDIGSATTNRSAHRLLPDATKANPILYPDKSSLSNSEGYLNLSAENLRIREKIVEVLSSNENQ